MHVSHISVYSSNIKELGCYKGTPTDQMRHLLLLSHDAKETSVQEAQKLEEFLQLEPILIHSLSSLCSTSSQTFDTDQSKQSLWMLKKLSTTFTAATTSLISLKHDFFIRLTHQNSYFIIPFIIVTAYIQCILWEQFG